MLFDMRGETVPKAAAISMVNRTLKDDGHSPSARECVEIVDALAAADGNDRVLNFTTLEFWTVADRILYPRACECEGESEREDSDVPAYASPSDYEGVLVLDRDGDYWKSDGSMWRLYFSLNGLKQDEPDSKRAHLPQPYAPYVRVEHLDSDDNEGRADDTVPAEAHAKDYPGVVVRDSDGDFWKSDGFEWSLSLSLDEADRGVSYADSRRLSLLFAPYVRVEHLDSDNNEDRACGCEDRLSEVDDLDPFTTCLLIDTFQLVLRNNDVSILDRVMARAAIETAKMSLPDGAMEAYRAAKAAR